MNVTDWLHFGMWGMLFGTAFIGLYSFTLRKEERNHVYLAGWITLIAATAYYAMSIDFGTIVINGQYVQLARYADWVITTPLLLITLITVGIPKHSKRRGSIITGVVGLDIYMILTGLFAALSGYKWPWYIFSCIALVLIAYMLSQVVYKESKLATDKKVTRLYANLALVLAALWFAYPVVWYLAESGVGAISYLNENAIYAVLDVTAKVGFGLLILGSIKSLSAKFNAKSGESTLEAASK
ncbi:bacteriorhodopsin [Candidatus Saccharibacteria bacterium]|nr:bacteriorhodopsin [Candidatus Saccharibacteria bacterium]